MAALVEGLAQAADVHVDGTCVDVRIVLPHGIEQLLARKDAAGMLDQMPEQAEFGRAELHRLAAASHPVRLHVHVDVARRSSCSPASAGRTRRSTAPTRASSSRGLNGLVT